MDEQKVKVRILELHNIGGIGNAGDEVWMSAADAEMYVRDGYVEVIEEAAPSALGLDTPQRTKARLLDHQEEEEDHAIMKPQAKRAKKRK